MLQWHDGTESFLNPAPGLGFGRLKAPGLGWSASDWLVLRSSTSSFSDAESRRLRFVIYDAPDALHYCDFSRQTLSEEWVRSRRC